MKFWMGVPDPWDKITLNGVSPEAREFVRRWDREDDERHGRLVRAPAASEPTGAPSGTKSPAKGA